MHSGVVLLFFGFLVWGFFWVIKLRFKLQSYVNLHGAHLLIQKWLRNQSVTIQNRHPAEFLFFLRNIIYGGMVVRTFFFNWGDNAEAGMSCGGGRGRRMVEGMMKLLQLALLKEMSVLCSESHWSRSSICLAGCWHLMKKVHKGVKGPLRCHQQRKAITHSLGERGIWLLNCLLKSWNASHPIPAWCHRWRSMGLFSFGFLVD